MRVDSVNVRVYSSPLRKCNSGKISRDKTSSQQLKCVDIPAFSGSHTLKWAGIGALVGLASMGAISAMSGGLAVPVFAYGLYAASFGTAGGIAGKAYDETQKANQ